MGSTYLTTLPNVGFSGQHTNFGNYFVPYTSYQALLLFNMPEKGRHLTLLISFEHKSRAAKDCPEILCLVNSRQETTASAQ